MNRKQLMIFLFLLLAFALSAFLIYAIFMDQIAASAGVPLPEMGVSNTVLGFANAGIVIVLYGLLGLAGLWFARKCGLPRIFSEDGNARRWFWTPLVLGLVCGAIAILIDVIFAPINGFGRIVHPGFPASILAAVSAGIGEEILFRGFVFGLWAFLLNILAKRFDGRAAALWLANLIAALAFGAGHLGTLLVLTGATSPADLNPLLVLETFLMNAIIGLVAGRRYMKDGLVAAVGVHFWTDVVFHVVWGLI
jgi:membrane protease YdiL (CAAX protease family)